MKEGWQETYKTKVGVYDTFSRYEDEDDKVLKKLLEKISFDGKVVLEIGCGSGKYTELLSPDADKYYALELSKPLIKLAKNKCKKIRGIKYFNCSAEKIPLKDNSVDIVFASWVLTAMLTEKMRKNSVKELLRVLKKDGEIFLFENHWRGEFMKLRGHGKAKMENYNIDKLVKTYGFNIFRTVNTNFFFPTLKEAKDVMSCIFGDNALRYFDKYPNPKVKHKVVILRRKK